MLFAACFTLSTFSSS